MKIKYKMVELISDDEHSSIWLSNVYLNEELRKHNVVLKSCKFNVTNNKSAELLFRERVNYFFNLKHPTITPLIDYGLINGRFYIVQDFIEGFSLQQLNSILSEKKLHLPLWFVLPVIYSLIQAIKVIYNSHNQALNQKNAEPVLRLTPSKIIISNRGKVKLVETGIFSSFIIDPDTLCKKKYQAPETVNDAITNECSDVYSLGVIFLEAITGIIPSADLNLTQITAKHSWIPKEIVRILERSLDKNPDKRYPDVDSLGIEIGNFIRNTKLKITHMDFVILLLHMFPQSKQLCSAKKHIECWSKKIEGNDPEKYTWFMLFSKMYDKSEFSQNLFIDNPLMHFCLALPENFSSRTSVSILGLPKGTAIQPLVHVDNHLKIVNTDNRPSIETTRQGVELLNQEFDGIIPKDLPVESSQYSKIDLWTNTRILRLSKSGGSVILNDFLKRDSKKTDNKAIDSKVDSATEMNSSKGNEFFELGLAALKLKEYEKALVLFEDALSRDPGNKIYTINIKQIKKIINKTKFN